MSYLSDKEKSSLDQCHKFKFLSDLSIKKSHLCIAILPIFHVNYPLKKKKNQKGISIINYYINLLSLKKKKKVHLSHYLSLRKKKKKKQPQQRQRRQPIQQKHYYINLLSL